MVLYRKGSGGSKVRQSLSAQCQKRRARSNHQQVGEGSGGIHRELQLDPSGFMAALERRERLNKLPPGKPLYARIIIAKGQEFPLTACISSDEPFGDNFL